MRTKKKVGEAPYRLHEPLPSFVQIIPRVLPNMHSAVIARSSWEPISDHRIRTQPCGWRVQEGRLRVYWKMHVQAGKLPFWGWSRRSGSVARERPDPRSRQQ